ncbi:MAG TPA: hypothetical protein DEO57_02915, partial [Phycisphaerales bacterium]|nr:hypothetical protein [Phycisphaerales bacterium]
MPQPSRRLRLIVPLIVGGLALLIILLVATGEGGGNRVQVKRDAQLRPDEAVSDVASPPTESEAPAAKQPSDLPAAPPPAEESVAAP